jgi:CHAT domain/PEGA domain
MKSIEVTITSLSKDALAASIDYHLDASPIVKKWQVDRAIVDGIWRAVRQAVGDALREPPAENDADRKREIAESLRSLGLALFQEIFMDESDRIRDLAAGAVTSSGDRPFIIFKIDKSLAYLPLELMYDGRAFLSHSLPVGRVLYAEEAEVRAVAQQRGPYSVVLVGDPSEDGAIRSDVEWEVDAVRDVFRGNRDFTLKIAVGREADEQRILADLPGSTVFHLSGHGVAPPDERRAGVKLRDGRVLGGQALKGLQNAPTFAFLNICTPASEETWKGSLGLIETLLRRGTRACIASLWEIKSQSAVYVARRFYAHLIAGVALGEALRRSRLEAAEKLGFHDPTWAAYALYGDPRWALIRRPIVISAGAGHQAQRTTSRIAVGVALAVLAALILIPMAVVKERAERAPSNEPAVSDTLAPSEPEETATQPEPVEVGYLVVASTPKDARVLLDGEELGTTPNTFEVPVGKHDLVLAKPGYKQWEASVEIKSSPRSNVTVALERLRR